MPENKQPDLRPYPFKIGPNNPRVFHVQGNVFWVAKASGPFEFAITSETFMPCKRGFRTKPDGDYNVVSIRVVEGSTDTVEGMLVLGHGSIDDFEPSVLLDIQGAITNLGGALDNIDVGITQLNGSTTDLLTVVTAIRVGVDKLVAGIGTSPAFPAHADLGNLATAAVATGRFATVIIGAGPAETWQLVTNATNPATDIVNGILKPADYNTGSNAKVWMRR